METPAAKEYSDSEFKDLLVELSAEFAKLGDLEVKFVSSKHYTFTCLTQAQLRLVEARGWINNAIALIQAVEQANSEQPKGKISVTEKES